MNEKTVFVTCFKKNYFKNNSQFFNMNTKKQRTIIHINHSFNFIQFS